MKCNLFHIIPRGTLSSNLTGSLWTSLQFTLNKLHFMGGSVFCILWHVCLDTLLRCCATYVFIMTWWRMLYTDRALLQVFEPVLPHGDLFCSVKWHWHVLDYSPNKQAEDTAINATHNRGTAQFVLSSIAVSSWAPHLPNFCFFMWFQAARVTKKDPLKWTLWIRSEMEKRRKGSAH